MYHARVREDTWRSIFGEAAVIHYAEGPLYFYLYLLYVAGIR